MEIVKTKKTAPGRLNVLRKVDNKLIRTFFKRFEETSALSTKCSPKDAAAKKCYGGFPRLATLIRQARNSSMPTLFLNAGDTYQGSAWFNVYKWKIVSKFLDILSPDAIVSKKNP